MKKIKYACILIVFIVLAALLLSIVLNYHNASETIPLETVLEEASDLTTQKMVVTDVFESTKGSIPILTKNSFLVQYHTTMTAGFDVTKAIVKETDEKVTITIPHCTVDEDSIKIKSEDIKFFDTNFAILNVDTEDVLEILSEAENHAKEKANDPEYGFLQAADENAKNIIRGLYENVVDGREIIVEFQ